MVCQSSSPRLVRWASARRDAGVDRSTRVSFPRILDLGMRSVPRPLFTTLALAYLAAAAVTGCGRGEPEGAWVNADMMTLPEGVPADALPEPDSRGARLALEYCSQCHGVPSPKRHSASDWIPTLRRMFVRMDHMSRMGGMMGRRGMMGRARDDMPMGMHGVDAPSDEERNAIVAYYTTNALRSVEPGALPAGEGAELFRDRCSQCHGLPDPSIHTPGEWPAVVDRMRENMERAGVEEPTDEEAAAIVGYLRRAAARE